MGQRFKVEQVMSPGDRKAFDEFLRQQLPTVNAAYEFVLAQGYANISRSAVYGYMVSTEDQLNDLRAAAEGAKAWVDVAREAGAVGFGEAASTSLSQRLMKTLFEMQADGEVDTDKLVKLSVALRNTMGSVQTLAEVRAAERKRAQEEAADAMAKTLAGKVASKKAITEEDIGEVRKAVFG